MVNSYKFLIKNQMSSYPEIIYSEKEYLPGFCIFTVNAAQN